jgi:hypothetical protein
MTYASITVDGTNADMDDPEFEHVEVIPFAADSESVTRCTECRAEFDSDGPQGDDVNCDELEDADGNVQRHTLEPLPLTWVNSAGLSLNEEEDSVTVSISVGDPRGAFTFTVRRVPAYSGEYSGRLMMHLPYPGESMPHAKITEIHPGTFVIG